jgi:hypothetical protein
MIRRCDLQFVGAVQPHTTASACQGLCFHCRMEMDTPLTFSTLPPFGYASFV